MKSDLLPDEVVCAIDFRNRIKSLVESAFAGNCDGVKSRVA
jgi:hypothetical protein